MTGAQPAHTLSAMRTVLSTSGSYADVPRTSGSFALATYVYSFTVVRLASSGASGPFAFVRSCGEIARPLPGAAFEPRKRETPKQIRAATIANRPSKNAGFGRLDSVGNRVVARGGGALESGI